MRTALRNWRTARSYRATLRGLRSLNQAELRTLWISPRDIRRVAREASRP